MTKHQFTVKRLDKTLTFLKAVRFRHATLRNVSSGSGVSIRWLSHVFLPLCEASYYAPAHNFQETRAGNEDRSWRGRVSISEG